MGSETGTLRDAFAAAGSSVFIAAGASFSTGGFAVPPAVFGTGGRFRQGLPADSEAGALIAAGTSFSGGFSGTTFRSRIERIITPSAVPSAERC